MAERGGPGLVSIGHLAAWPAEGDDGDVLRKGQPSLADVVELLYGIGRMLQEIDAKLGRIVQLLEEESE